MPKCSALALFGFFSLVRKIKRNNNRKKTKENRQCKPLNIMFFLSVELLHKISITLAFGQTALLNIIFQKQHSGIFFLS